MGDAIHTNGSRKERVLLVSMNHPKIRPGGAEGYALDLYETIRDAGELEPIFLARTGPPFTSVPRYHAGTPFTTVNDDPNQYLLYNDLGDYDWLYGKSPQRSMATRFFREFLLNQKPDLIHFQHTLFLGYDFVRVARNTLPNAPIVYMLHEYLPICFRDGQMVRTKNSELCQEESPRRCHECFPQISPQAFFMRKRFIQSHLSLVDLFVAPSDYVRERYVQWGIPAEKIMVEPYACVPEPDPAGPGEDRPRNRFAFFGQFTPYKGADVLLKAMGSLGPDFDGHLWIHGANLETQSDEFKSRFAGLLAKTSETVTFAGPYDHDRELRQLMARTDWVIVPSIWWETGPTRGAGGLPARASGDLLGHRRDVGEGGGRGQRTALPPRRPGQPGRDDAARRRHAVPVEGAAERHTAGLRHRRQLRSGDGRLQEADRRAAAEVERRQDRTTRAAGCLRDR